MTVLTVDLDERSYPIHIETGLLNNGALLNQSIHTSQIVIVTNTTIKPLYGERLQKAFGDRILCWIVLPDGEQYKTLQQFEQIMSELLQAGAARDITLVALGGGVIGDITGFAAACYQRGVAFVQVPTTLLAQVDSSVGGKTAVNHPLGKNMIGAFYQPQAVLIDLDTLATLPSREFSAGMAEVIKYGIIYDPAFFAWLEQHVDELVNREQDALRYAISRSCEIKADVVNQDETEQGIRAILNLGHTFGHAIEAEQGYGNWLHGEAVATGMVLAANVAKQMEWLTESEVWRIKGLLEAFGLPVKPPADMGYAQFMPHMRRDKKVQQGQIRFVIPVTLGQAKVTLVEDEVLKAILN